MTFSRDRRIAIEQSAVENYFFITLWRDFCSFIRKEVFGEVYNVQKVPLVFPVFFGDRVNGFSSNPPQEKT
jgi:hypothetical protein